MADITIGEVGENISMPSGHGAPGIARRLKAGLVKHMQRIVEERKKNK